MNKADIDEALKTLKNLIGDDKLVEVAQDGERLSAVLKILDTLGAEDSIEALKTIGAAKTIFDMVSEIEYTAMAVSSLKKEGGNAERSHLNKLKELMQKFPDAAIRVLNAADIDAEIKDKELIVSHSTVGIRTAFDYYQRVVAIVMQLDDQAKPVTIEEVLVQIESFARTHLKAFGWEIRGGALPHNMKQYIMDMQNLN